MSVIAKNSGLNVMLLLTLENLVLGTCIKGYYDNFTEVCEGCPEAVLVASSLALNNRCPMRCFSDQSSQWCKCCPYDC